MNRQGKLVYDLKLTQLDLKLAHKSVNELIQPNKPSIWTHASQHFAETGEPYMVEGHVFVFGKPNEIMNWSIDKKRFPNLKAFVHWGNRNMPRRDRFSGHERLGYDIWKEQMFVRLPDGTWASSDAKTRPSWFTIDFDKGGWDHEPREYKENRRRLLTNNYKQLSYEEELVLSWIIDGFFDSWKKARKEFRQELKVSGEFRKRIDRDRNQRAAEWTQSRMDLALVATDLREELDGLIKALENDTVTKASLTGLYNKVTLLVKESKDVSKKFDRVLRRNRRK